MCSAPLKSLAGRFPRTPPASGGPDMGMEKPQFSLPVYEVDDRPRPGAGGEFRVLRIDTYPPSTTERTEVARYSDRDDAVVVAAVLNNFAVREVS